MKRPTENLALKITAVFLSFLLVIVAEACAIGLLVALDQNYYEAASWFGTEAPRRLTVQTQNTLMENFFACKDDPDGLARMAEAWSRENSNVAYEIVNAAEPDVVLARNYLPDQVGREYSYDWTYHTETETESYCITLRISADLAARDEYYDSARLYDFLYPLRFTVIVLLVICVLLFLIDLIFLLCAAGHRRGMEGVTSNKLDRIPFDLFLAAVIFLGALLISGVADTFYYRSEYESVLVAALVAIPLYALILMTVMTFATRVKLGGWWRNTVVFRLLRWLSRQARQLGRLLRKGVLSLPMVWRTALMTVGLLLLYFFIGAMMFNSYSPGPAFLIFFVLSLAIFLALCWVSLTLQRLKKAGQELAAGNVDYKVDTRHMFWDFKCHGENLNSIASGMAIAVEQRLKSERLKTELITNVSHDIKTPLTSIINYVDLLQRAETPEQREEYLAVLDRQAQRLKKLTEDLVEASKASTGNMAVELVRTDVGELVNQCVGEYAERLAAGRLESVTELPGEPLHIMADGRLLWRVMDNLLGNVCKYAQAGTRVYLDVARAGDEVVIAVKNISRDRLNIPAEELMERFVRGDASRSTEGSGLGLNIARSLTELQGGGFALSVDGDLFKAEMRFRAV